MFNCLIKQNDLAANQSTISIIPVFNNQFPTWLAEQNEFTRNWIKDSGFKAEKNNFCLIPNAEGHCATVILHLKDSHDFWGFGHLARALPIGIYDINAITDAKWQEKAVFAWILGAYRFNRYKKAVTDSAKLVVPEFENYVAVEQLAEAIYLVRDLINTPTENMHPSDLGEAAVKLSQKFSAKITQIVGDDLLKQNYPAIHAVGRASTNPPRLIDIHWGETKNPKLTLVGKGVCFDTGGLDLKTSAGMALMKKDMGGAAHVLGLAYLIMAAKLPVRLRVLIPAVENAVSGDAYRPGDIIPSRKGLSIEIGNTDAEGRVILADALAEAVSESPDLIIDFATLTGAAKVALGPDLPALFSASDMISEAVTRHARRENDPVWAMPLYAPYRELINSNFADINNNSNSAYGGAITAALFLQDFVGAQFSNWIHIDNMAWNVSDKPGRPLGGEAMGLRAIFAYLQERYEVDAMSMN